MSPTSARLEKIAIKGNGADTLNIKRFGERLQCDFWHKSKLQRNIVATQVQQLVACPEKREKS